MPNRAIRGAVLPEKPVAIGFYSLCARCCELQRHRLAVSARLFYCGGCATRPSSTTEGNTDGGQGPESRHTGANALVAGPIARSLIAFSLPTLASNILQSLNGSINAVWVGRLLGKTGLAATSNANLIMFLVFALIFGFI